LHEAGAEYEGFVSGQFPNGPASRHMSKGAQRVKNAKKLLLSIKR